MKDIRIINVVVFVLGLGAACSTVSRYRGAGEIENTSYWGEGMQHQRQYTVRLGSIDMRTNIQKEFDLGRLSAFFEPEVTVCICLNDNHFWKHLANADASTLKLAKDLHWQNLDGIKCRFGYRLSDQSRLLLEQPERPLNEYVWSESPEKDAGSHAYRIYKLENANFRCPRGSRLNLSISFSGNEAMTNVADLEAVIRLK